MVDVAGAVDDPARVEITHVERGDAFQAPDRIRIADIRFDPLDEPRAEDRVVRDFQAGRGGRVVFVNVDVAAKVRRDPRLGHLVSGADLVLADGMPLIWASRLRHTPLPERVAGSTMLSLLAARAAAEGVPIMLVGGQPGSAEAATSRLLQANPGLRAGWHTPPFGFQNDPAAMVSLEKAMDGFGPCLCFIGLGFPKQERLMERLSATRPDWWFIASGGSIDFVARGDRAPVWMQRSGLEWLHRLSREPKRLARRYLIEGIPFVASLLTASAWTPIGSDRRGPPR